jgi:hypothetical protein
LDRDGNFYGIFTVNEDNPGRPKLEPVLQILANYDTIMQDFVKIVDSLD